MAKNETMIFPVKSSNAATAIAIDNPTLFMKHVVQAHAVIEKRTVRQRFRRCCVPRNDAVDSDDLGEAANPVVANEHRVLRGVGRRVRLGAPPIDGGERAEREERVRMQRNRDAARCSPAQKAA